MPHGHDQPTDPLGLRTGPEWRDLAGRLRRCAGALAGPRRPDLADDLVQDAVARLLARADAPPTYAYARACLVRLFLDHERAARRRAARALRWAFLRPRAAPSSRAERDAAALHAALERLSPMQRSVVTLRLVEELPYDAIAAALDSTPDSIRATLHAARRRLRADLAPTGVDR